MSLVYSNTTNKNGIIQTIERIIYGDNGDGRITGNTQLFEQFNGDINLALDSAFTIIFNADGRWQFDDRNHDDYPILTTDLVAGQRDYSFTVDSNSVLILEVQKILVAGDDGIYREVKPIDVQTDRDTVAFWDGNNAQGTPIKYDKTANAIFLDPIPSYNETNGLKMYISREASYFTTSDTAKMPGIAGIFHEYLAIRPAYQYAYRNSLSNMNALRDEMLRMEQLMETYYGRRNEDVRKRITPSTDSNK